MAPKSPKKSPAVSKSAVSPLLGTEEPVAKVVKESILLNLPFECLSNMFYRYLEDDLDLFDRARSLDRLRSVCKLFKDVGSTVDNHLLCLSGIGKVRDLLPELKEDAARCAKIHVVAIKTLNHGVKTTLKSVESTAKALPEKPRRLRDIFALLSLLPNLRRIDLRVNGKRGTVEVKDLMTPLKTLPCLEKLEALSIEFPRAWDYIEDWQTFVPRTEWADMQEMLCRLGQLKSLKVTTLSLTANAPANAEDEKPEMPPCRVKVLQADNVNNAFATWLNGSSDMQMTLADGCLSSHEPAFRCSAVTDLTLARLSVMPTTQVSMPNLVSLRATGGCDFASDVSLRFFEDMPLLQHLELPIAPSKAYSRTRANTRATRIHEEIILFVQERQLSLATLQVISENWDSENMLALEQACAHRGTDLTWRSLYKT